MRRAMLAAAIAACAVAGCSPAATDKGAVAATVGGSRITTADLEAEMRVTGVANPDDPNVRREVLEKIIARKLLAHAAHDSGLSTSVDARRVRDIAREDFDASLDRSATLSKVTPPTEADAATFVGAHPEMFANRTVYLLDQIQTPTRPPVPALQALQPTKTLEEADAVLTQYQVAHRRAPAAIDTLRTPGFAKILTQLPAGEVFIIPEGGGVSINRVRAAETQPLTGAAATAVAKELLLGQRRDEALRNRLQALKAAQVQYGAAYAPPATPEK